MNRILSIILIVIAAIYVMTAPEAIAADLADGAKVFSLNCAACHMGGGNVVNAGKTLKKDALEKYEMASLNAIKNQVLNGKAAMPSFKGRLSATQIDDVAAYVLEQSEKGW